MKKIQKLSFFLFATLLLVACGDARFDRIPGRYQDLMPTDLIGVYEFKGKDFKSVQTDSLQITVTPGEIQFKTPSKNTVWNIHQNFHLFSLNQYHVLGTADKTIKGLWNLTVIEVTAAGLKVYPVSENKLETGLETTLMKYLPVKDLLLQHDPIMAVPSSADGSMVPLAEGAGAADMVRYYSMNDEQFMQYIDRELVGKEYFFLKKVVQTKETKAKENKDLKKGK